MTIAWSKGLKHCVGSAIPVSRGWPPEGIPENLAHRQQQARHNFRHPLRCKWGLQCKMVCKYRGSGTTSRSHLQGPNILLGLLHPWKWDWLVVPKRRYVNNTLRCLISQKSADRSSKLMATMNRNDGAQVVLIAAKEMVKTGYSEEKYII